MDRQCLRQSTSFITRIVRCLADFFLFLPDLENGLMLLKHPKQLFFQRASWQLPRRPDSKRMIAAIVLGMLLPYFHGAVVVALLLMLVVLAVFSENRLSDVFFALAVLLAAGVQTSVFAVARSRSCPSSSRVL